MIKNKSMNLVPLFTIVTYVVMIIVNVMANALPINGQNTGDVSDAYINLFAPAPVTFSIWGLIYLLLLGYIVYQMMHYKSYKAERDNILIKTGLIFSVSSIANTIWIFAWHYNNILLSLSLMIVILSCLIVINILLRNREFDIYQNIFIKLPFNVYLGWITVATIANVTTFLVSIEWNRLGISDYIWTIIIVMVGGVIGHLAMVYYRSIAYGLVVIWAYAGIGIKHLSESGFNGEYLSIVVTVFIAIALLIAGEARLVVGMMNRNT